MVYFSLGLYFLRTETRYFFTPLFCPKSNSPMLTTRSSFIDPSKKEGLVGWEWEISFCCATTMPQFVPDIFSSGMKKEKQGNELFYCDSLDTTCKVTRDVDFMFFDGKSKCRLLSLAVSNWNWFNFFYSLSLSMKARWINYSNPKLYSILINYTGFGVILLVVKYFLYLLPTV